LDYLKEKRGYWKLKGTALCGELSLEEAGKTDCVKGTATIIIIIIMSSDKELPSFYSA
jgi:hypothetical protein